MLASGCRGEGFAKFVAHFPVEEWRAISFQMVDNDGGFETKECD
jgi:hypothetical protein